MLIEECAGRCDRTGMVVGNNMSDARDERIARYKEERRRQLAAQFGPRDHQNNQNQQVASPIRSTRASRLRSQANSDSFKNNRELIRDEETSPILVKSRITSKRISDGSDIRRKSMVSPNLVGICSPKTKKPPTSSPPSNSPIPRSAQLVKRISSNRNERGLTPESDSSLSGKDAVPSLNSKSNPTSPAKHPSILKKSSLDEPLNPISILKRKTSNDEQIRCSSPLRFSPNVVERKGRGILKKHRSLDDPQVRVSTEAVLQDDEHRSILKSQQRRCSLDEVVKRAVSPEPQSILKRKASREEIENGSEPQGILKKKTSITEEPIFETSDPRPILKKKSFEDEEQLRPILKTWRRSIGDNAFAEIKQSEEVKPILKHTEVVMRNKKSLQEKRLFRHSLPCSVEGKWLSVAERVNGLENFMSYIQDSRMDEGKENGTKGLVRSGSVSERATIFSQIEKQEKLAAEAARAKRNLRGFRSRKSEPNRFSTQPVTSDEVEQAKRNNDPDCDDDPSRLTLAERVALFTKKPENKDALLPPPPAPKRIISNSMSGILVEGLMKNLAHKDSGTKRLELRKSPVESEESSTSTEDEEDADDSDHREQEEGKENRDVTKLLARIKDSNTSSEEASSGGKEVQDILNLRRGFKKRSQEMMGEVTALRRCATQPIPRDEVDDMPKTTIAERLAALRKNDNNWLKRVPKAKPDEEIVSLKPPSGGVNRVSDRLGQLETASQGWKARVGDKDAVQFTVAGKMSSEQLPPAPNLGGANRKPKPVIFTKNGVSMASASTPSVPDSLAALMKRSISVPEGEEDDKDPARIKVPETYDDDFSSFFANADVSLMSNFTDVDIDFEEISHSSQLHVQRRNVRVQRKHKSANPLKALAARTDLKTEYVEVKMGVADREIRRMNIEKLSKNCGLAVEALAGLASKEDLSAISLRKAAEGSPSVKQWNHPILLRIKGRRRPLTTIVKPHYKTINQGDSFILVTQNKVFHWVGEYSNVIEKSRGADIALHIQTKKDLGCSASSVVNLDGTIFTERHREFWKILNLPENLMETYKGENAGHPGEDEVYEKAISETFVVYSLTGEKLVPVESYWGRCPKIDILDPSKVLVFDFGSEVYMWAGKNADMKERRQGNSLANELYKSGYRNNWQPTSIIWLDDEMENDSRPEWSIFSKVTQHMEPIVFKEKFIDWPDFTRVIRTKDKSNNKQHNGSVNVHPCDYKAMLNWSIPEPDLVLEGSHLGRGKHYYDEERRLNYEVTTKDVKVWQIENNVKTLIDKSCLGNFHEEDSYVVRWHYCVSTSARELSGLPSKHADLGRDRIAHMVWHGRKAPVVEQGTAALLTSLGDDDSDHGPILTVDQGTETPAFAAIFPGPVVFHYSPPHDNERLYLITGEIEEEILLHEVKCESSQLRSRASLWFLNVITGKSYLWHGAKTSQEKQNMAYKAVTYLKSTCPKEFGLDDYTTITIKEIEEGDEPYEFLGGSTRIDRESYCSLLKYEVDCDWTPRLFHLSSLLGDFIACPVVPARHHPKIVTPYPYTKKDLYSTSQPSLLLLDVGNELWLWCGWWEGDLDARGTAWGRYQAERKAAMTTALQYWTEKGGNTSSVFIVYAGLEPSKFKSYFALWEDKCDPAYEFNVLEGHYDGEVKKIQDELATLEERCYPVSELTSYPLPGGVDPTRLEYYLDPVDFKKLLGVSKEEFEELPIWKRTNLKKTACLF